MSKARSKASQFYDQYHKAILVHEEDPAMQARTMAMYDWHYRQLGAEPKGRLLDLSCGQGLFLKYSAKRFPGLELHGLDHSPFAVKVTSQQVPGVKAKVGDALATKYPAKHFDTVTCLGSLEHYPDSVEGLREIHRILKDDGRALIFVPNLFFLGYIYLVWRTGEPPHEAGQNQYERFETRRGWEELFEKVGFQVESCEKYNEMVATKRVPNFVRVLFNWIVAPLVPLNLSYGFAYVVRKAPRKR